MQAMEDQLIHAPSGVTRNKKMLEGLVPPWTAEVPVWELRVGDYRVFYDVSEEERVVCNGALQVARQRADGRQQLSE